MATGKGITWTLIIYLGCDYCTFELTIKHHQWFIIIQRIMMISDDNPIVSIPNTLCASLVLYWKERLTSRWPFMCWDLSCKRLYELVDSWMEAKLTFTVIWSVCFSLWVNFAFLKNFWAIVLSIRINWSYKLDAYKAQVDGHTNLRMWEKWTINHRYEIESNQYKAGKQMDKIEGKFSLNVSCHWVCICVPYLGSC